MVIIEILCLGLIKSDRDWIRLLIKTKPAFLTPSSLIKHSFLLTIHNIKLKDKWESKNSFNAWWFWKDEEQIAGV